MKEKLLLTLACLFVSVGIMTAQTSKVTGVVTSAEDGLPVVGASILVAGTTQGTITDIDGKFTISGVPATAKTLHVSYVGMAPQDVTIKDGVLKIVLKSDAKALDEVVVTAMGIKRSEKILGYASSTVKNDDLIAAKSGSVMAGLSGKVAGLNISNSGTAGSSQKVIVRGYSSFANNQPLYVIDGVPISNNTSLSNDKGNGVIEANDAVDFGNGANDINPEDVESVTILKGASATALYGSRAANGVIMITTKRAKQEKLTVSYDGSFMASNVLRVPQDQDKFGQGWGTWDRSENGSWGPALDGRMNEWGSYNLDPQMKKHYSFIKDNLRNFYTTGFEMNNNISIRTGTEKVGLFLSYGNTTSNGILPNNADKYERNTFSLRGNMKFDKFSADVNVSYIRKDMTKAAAGQGKAGATMQQELIQHPVDIDYSVMKDFNDIRYDGNNYYTWYAQNPYWVLANNKNNYQDDRIYGKLELAYEVMPGLKAVGRLGGDFTNSRQKLRTAKLTYAENSYSADGGKSDERGTYTERSDNYDQLDATLFMNANYNIGEDITLGGTLGWNLNQRKSSYLKSYLDGLFMAGWYNLENGIDKPLSTNYRELRRTIGAFGQVEFGYKNFWFVNLSGRNDWSSTLPIHANSFFYGGINTSVILTDMIPSLKNNIVNYLKVRAAWGQTGNDANVYRTMPYFVPTQISTGFGYIYTPLNGALGLTEYNRQANNHLKPEKTSEWELGITTNFIDNRINIDFAYYNKLTKDQIIAANVAPETRYTTATRNVGKISNKGIELSVNLTPIRNKDIQWDLGVTFSKNWSKVKELWNEGDTPVTEYVLQTAYSANFVAKVGEPLGIFQVPAIATVQDPNSPYYGKVIVDANGIPTTSNSEMKTIGSSAPDFNMGFNTRITYKGFTLSAVADWRKGGYMYSYTAQLMHFVGNTTRSVFNNREPFVVPNSVMALPNGGYAENNNPVTSDNMSNFYSDAYSRSQFENFVIPKGYVKLRELVLSYSFPKVLISKLGIQQLDLSFIGRNLFMWTPKANNYVDPEITNFGNDILSEIGEFASLPSTRNIGGGIKIVF
ncbi:SusC/RagA family TonB-linked outer membrane protein [Bacteroides bouchesdurhonensis]|uniref:SusC/RagA family TonB-linked outer membrane protein n=1 Tax=Bacteroides bouchesdurhonensis TaxID=1841855 RepID=UPI0009FADC51|nr:SusC/RagA family TonB-linked outer membrane protein [Bacteroides bouchesdurhonensis]